MATLKNARNEGAFAVAVVSEADGAGRTLGGRRVAQTHSHSLALKKNSANQSLFQFKQEDTPLSLIPLEPHPLRGDCLQFLFCFDGVPVTHNLEAWPLVERGRSYAGAKFRTDYQCNGNQTKHSTAAL